MQVEMQLGLSNRSTAGLWIMLFHSTSFGCNIDEKKKNWFPAGVTVCVEFAHCSMSAGFLRQLWFPPTFQSCAREVNWQVYIVLILASMGVWEWPCDGWMSCLRQVSAFCTELLEETSTSHTLNWNKQVGRSLSYLFSFIFLKYMYSFIHLNV